MTTQIIWHPDIYLHDAEAQHQAMEKARIRTIAEAVLAVPAVIPVQAKPATVDQITLNHTLDFFYELMKKAPLEANVRVALDSAKETVLNRYTLRAVRLSVGAACQGVDAVLDGQATNVFCPIYAGHHAEPKKAAGFCFLNSVAIAAKYALSRGVKRLAILDIDTHSGNGTILSFLKDDRVLFAETYQEGYPGSFLPGFRPDHVLRTRVAAPYQYREAWTELLAKVKAYDPELILVSAGFDAHMADPLGRVNLLDSDYVQLAKAILEVSPHVVACLEGGYDVAATSRCAALFVREMVAAGQK